MSPTFGEPKTSAGGYCGMHGAYVGWLCPKCSTAVIEPPPRYVPPDPMDRIADALERIAAQLEGIALKR